METNYHLETDKSIIESVSSEQQNLSCSSEQQTEESKNNEIPNLMCVHECKNNFEKVKLVVPDSFICPITFRIMEDPYVDQFGVSYEKSAIYEWLDIKKISPIAQKCRLTKNNLIPNRNLKTVIELFKKEHPECCGEYKVTQLSNIYISSVDFDNASKFCTGEIKSPQAVQSPQAVIQNQQNLEDYHNLGNIENGIVENAVLDEGPELSFSSCIRTILELIGRFSIFNNTIYKFIHFLLLLLFKWSKLKMIYFAVIAFMCVMIWVVYVCCKEFDTYCKINECHKSMEQYGIISNYTVNQVGEFFQLILTYLYGNGSYCTIQESIIYNTYTQANFTGYNSIGMVGDIFVSTINKNYCSYSYFEKDNPNKDKDLIGIVIGSIFLFLSFGIFMFMNIGMLYDRIFIKMLTGNQI
jgi:hypothetical protein